jgi:hypothetical protein
MAQPNCFIIEKILLVSGDDGLSGFYKAGYGLQAINVSSIVMAKGISIPERKSFGDKDYAIYTSLDGLEYSGKEVTQIWLSGCGFDFVVADVAYGDFLKDLAAVGCATAHAGSSGFLGGNDPKDAVGSK